MNKWLLAFSLWFGCIWGNDCDNPCQPQNYNGMACCLIPTEFFFPPCDHPRGGDLNFKFTANFGETISTCKDWITLELCARQFFRCYETYLDGKWHYFSNWKNAANIGIGVRTYDAYCIVGGANLYYDYRRGPCQEDFHQISGGFEFFHPCFNFYVNAYYPFQRRKCLESNVFSFEGGFLACCRENMCSFGGFDLELDKTLLYWCKARISFGVGGYFYDNTVRHQWFGGGRVRLVADLSTNLRAEVETTYDKYFKSRTVGKISLNIPFPCWGMAKKSSGCRQSWCPPFPQRRNNLIVLRKEVCWDWNFDDRFGLRDRCGCQLHEDNRQLF